MDVNKNSYTFGFAAVMVVVVAALLSVAAILLKPSQSRNILLEKKQNILSSVGINIDREAADIQYPIFVKEELVLNYKGEEIDGVAFDVDLQKELKKDKTLQSLPLFISEVDGKKQYIIPLRGKGLWGPIWGFISLENDLNKVFGAVFDHKSETPGLGAEISQDNFEDQFVGKLISNGNNYKAVEVNKPGNPLNEYQVDGISGGTFTSVGVEEMMSRTLLVYHKYIKNLNKS